MKHCAAIVVCLVVTISYFGAEGARQKPPSNDVVTGGPPRAGGRLDQDEGIRIAREHAARDYGPLDGYKVSVCKQELAWRVYFDPRDISRGGSGMEYVVSAIGGRVLGHRKLPLAASGTEHSSNVATLSRSEAEKITRRDAVRAYGSLEPYEVTVCELSRAWRFIYSPKNGLNGGGPEYVIDKAGGQILDKKYSQ